MRTSSVLGATAATVLLASLGTAPALAGSEVGLSLDGSHWSDRLSRPLFAPGLRWVPGDREVASFYVRNQGPTGARLTVGVQTRDPDEVLAGDDLLLMARAAGGPWVRLDNGADVVPLLSGALARTDEVRVDVRAVLRWSATSRSEARALPFDLVVRLSQLGLDGGMDDGGVLPGTGSEVRIWVVVLGAGLVGGGLVLVLLTRRRREADDG